MSTPGVGRRVVGGGEPGGVSQFGPGMTACSPPMPYSRCNSRRPGWRAAKRDQLGLDTGDLGVQGVDDRQRGLDRFPPGGLNAGEACTNPRSPSSSLRGASAPWPSKVADLQRLQVPHTPGGPCSM